MRLLHTTELRFEEFFDDEVPRYAILSHRWGRKEVSFQEMQYLVLDEAARARFLTPGLLAAQAKAGGEGHRKILDMCEFSARAGYARVWIDTCCIDKTSSAELSEAINSMYEWYCRADACYVYMSDVSPSKKILSERRDFSRSAWWTRGWTLQELLAPVIVVFLDCCWGNIGTKADLADVIQEITGIDKKALTGKRHVHNYPVAVRMSWASHRKTSRREDIAYCLFGLFDLHLPLLYGEGDRAFKRFSMATLSERNDQSTLVHDGANVLAESPADYEYFEEGEVFQYHMVLVIVPIDPWNRGIRLQGALFVEATMKVSRRRVRLVRLICASSFPRDRYLHLTLVPPSLSGDIWCKDQAFTELSEDTYDLLDLSFRGGKIVPGTIKELASGPGPEFLYNPALELRRETFYML